MSIQIQLYREMVEVAEQMVIAAGENDWERLVDLEHHVALLRSRVQATEEDMLSDDEIKAKRDLIQRVLAHDAEVRRHTEPWMEQVRRFLGAGANQRRVENAYGAMR